MHTSLVKINETKKGLTWMGLVLRILLIKYPLACKVNNTLHIMHLQLILLLIYIAYLSLK